MRCRLQRIGIILLIAFLFSGCAYYKQSILPFFEAKEDLAIARELADKGDISKAEEKYQSIIRRYPKSPESGNALLELSYLYISPKNKEKDFSKAYEGFKAFLEKYPKHRKAEIVRYIFAVLKEIESLEAEKKELKDALINLEMLGRELKK